MSFIVVAPIDKKTELINKKKRIAFKYSFDSTLKLIIEFHF